MPARDLSFRMVLQMCAPLKSGNFILRRIRSGRLARVASKHSLPFNAPNTSYPAPLSSRVASSRGPGSPSTTRICVVFSIIAHFPAWKLSKSLAAPILNLICRRCGLPSHPMSQTMTLADKNEAPTGQAAAAQTHLLAWSDRFVRRHIGPDAEAVGQMLDFCGYPDLAALIDAAVQIGRAHV